MQVEINMKRRCLRSWANRCGLLELPLMLIHDILSMLDVRTIFICKCVCKTFVKILTDPYFIELHLTKAPNVDNCLLIYSRLRTWDVFLVFDYRLDLEKSRSKHSFFNSRLCQTLAVPAGASQWTRNYDYHCQIIEGSCNGLLCVRYSTYRNRNYFICNPVLGEFFALPPVVQSLKFEYTSFGFCSKTKQYKVIRVGQKYSFDKYAQKSSICMIHTLGTDCWREIENHPLPPLYDGCGTYLEGNLYWLTKNDAPSEAICSFNLETEQHSYISAPTDYYACRKRVGGLRTGSLEGLLCFSYQIGYRFEVFVMKDSGVNGCWTKEFSVDFHSYSMFQHNFIEATRFFNNGDLVFRHQYKSKNDLWCWNLRTGTMWKCVPGCDINSDVVSFVPNFTSLKDIIAGGHVEIVQTKRMGRNFWSSNGFRLKHNRSAPS